MPGWPNLAAVHNPIIHSLCDDQSPGVDNVGTVGATR